jgi:hypothetical protein
VDFGSRAWVKLAGEGLRRAIEADQDLRERPGVYPAVSVMLDGGREAGRCPENSDRRNVVERDLAGVDEAGFPGNADVNDSAARLDET